MNLILTLKLKYGCLKELRLVIGISSKFNIQRRIHPVLVRRNLFKCSRVSETCQRADKYDLGPMKDSCCFKESTKKEGKYPKASKLVLIETLPLLSEF